MKLVFPTAKELKNVIASTVAFLNEATFTAKEDGLHLLAIDPSNVAIINVELNKDCFLEYEANNDKFTISLEDLKKILSKAKARDTVILEIEDKDRMLVTLKGKTTKKFKLPLIEDVESQLNELPKLDLPVTAELDAKAFKEIIEGAKIVSEELKIVSDPEGPTLSIIGDGGVKEMRVDLTPEDETVLSLEVPTKAVSKYGIDYLSKLTAVSTISDTVLLKFDSNKPIHLEYKLVDRLRYVFLLAPRD